MKKVMLLLLLTSGFMANAQSLKDLLYNGTLKTDSGSVIRKGDDLSSKIDTAKKKPVEPQKTIIAGTLKNGVKTGAVSPIDSAVTANSSPKDNATVTKDNNKLWKEFVDSVTSTLKTEVLPSKKIKKGDYLLLVDYEIGLDGQITITNVFCSPENSFLQEQVKERLGISTPQLNPVMGGNGKPRKVIKRYTLNLSKE